MDTHILEFVEPLFSGNIDSVYESSGCGSWVPFTNASSTLVCESRPTSYQYLDYCSVITRQPFELSIPVCSPDFLILNESKKGQETEIKTILDNLASSFKFENENEIISFFVDNQIIADDILETFLDINKLIFSEFQDNVKSFVQKYDDPETKDHFISVYIRRQIYTDDFIDLVWKIREDFLEKCPQNDWILITTDFKQLSG